MSEARQPVRIAINVMRARLTVVGFNLAIITFQISIIPQFPGAIQLPNAAIPLHIVSDIALLIGFALSIVAMVSFIVSSQFDREGCCNHWSLLAGDLFMYLALAHSVAGFFGPILHVLDQATLNVAPQAGELQTVRIAALIAGGFAWVVAIYVGPAVSLFRSPFGRRVTVTLGGMYLLLLLLAAYVNTQAVRLEAARNNVAVDPEPTWLNELYQPLRW